MLVHFPFLFKIKGIEVYYLKKDAYFFKLTLELQNNISDLNEKIHF